MSDGVPEHVPESVRPYVAVVVICSTKPSYRFRENTR